MDNSNTLRHATNTRIELPGNGDGDPGDGDGDGEGVCGNGIIDADEDCDDGNMDAWDGCNNFCSANVVIGSYNVADGPSWVENPPTYTCREACALVFGGVADDYRCSTNNVNITQTGYYSGWGDPQYCDNAQPDDWKLNTFYDCGGVGCSYSAYVQDHCGNSINYCWQ